MKIQISNEILADELIVADVDGKYHALSDGQSFRYDCPIMFCVADMTDVDSIYPDSAIMQGDIDVHEDLVPYKPVYVEGYFSNSILGYPMFAPVKITQELPSEDNRTQYLLLGYAYDEHKMFLQADHPIFSYQLGMFTRYTADGVIGIVHKQVPIKCTAKAKSNISVFWESDMSEYLPDNTHLVAANFGWTNGSCMYSVNTQVINNKLYMTLYNPGAARELTSISITLFYK